MRFITPAIERAGWDKDRQIRRELYFTAGRIVVRGKLVNRGKPKFADYVLFYQRNLPLAIVEAKDNKQPVGAGMQQALEYAETLDVPFVFTSNGDGFVFHDRTGLSSQVETELGLDDFPSPEALWVKYVHWKGLDTDQAGIVTQPFHEDASGKAPRYYQRIAANRTVEAIATGQDRVLLVMATGTGKTYTAFQIIYRLWKAGQAKRILFLADRNILVDQTMKLEVERLVEGRRVVGALGSIGASARRAIYRGASSAGGGGSGSLRLSSADPPTRAGHVLGTIT